MALTVKKLRDADGNVIDPSAIYISVTGFGGIGISVPQGARLLGSNEAVQRCPSNFLPDGSDDSALHRARTRIYLAAEEDAAEAAVEYAPPPPRRLAPRGTMVAIRPAGEPMHVRAAKADGSEITIPPGIRVHKDHPSVKRFAGSFVETVPSSVKDLATALICVDPVDLDGRLIFPGQFLDRDDQAVTVNPWAFALPDRDEDLS